MRSLLPRRPRRFHGQRRPVLPQPRPAAVRSVCTRRERWVSRGGLGPNGEEKCPVKPAAQRLETRAGSISTGDPHTGRLTGTHGPWRRELGRKAPPRPGFQSELCYAPAVRAGARDPGPQREVGPGMASAAQPTAQSGGSFKNAKCPGSLRGSHPPNLCPCGDSGCGPIWKNGFRRYS